MPLIACREYSSYNCLIFSWYHSIFATMEPDYSLKSTYIKFDLPQTRSKSSDSGLIKTILENLAFRVDFTSLLIPKESSGAWSVVAMDNNNVYKLFINKKIESVYIPLSKASITQLIQDYENQYIAIKKSKLKIPQVKEIYNVMISDNDQHVFMEIQQRIDEPDVLRFFENQENDSLEILSVYRKILDATLAINSEIGKTISITPHPANFSTSGVYLDLLPPRVIGSAEYLKLKSNNLSDSSSASSEFNKRRFEWYYTPLGNLQIFYISFIALKPELSDKFMDIILEKASNHKNDMASYVHSDLFLKDIDYVAKSYVKIGKPDIAQRLLKSFIISS